MLAKSADFHLLDSAVLDCRSMETEVGLFGRYPLHQNAVDLFRGEWASVFPKKAEIETGGFAGTFEDGRIRWAADRLGGFAGRSFLELGPLEGGHTYALEQLGASSVLAIEVSPRAYLKCLVAKEIMKISRAEFLLGDCMEYVSATDRRFDIGIASGILYHMMDPVSLIKQLARCCDGLFVWTHYYDAEMTAKRPEVARRFSSLQKIEIDDVSYQLAPYSYASDPSTNAFCGGHSSGSRWMTEKSLFEALRTYGFNILDVHREDHPNGPAIWIAAQKQV